MRGMSHTLGCQGKRHKNRHRRIHKHPQERGQQVVQPIIFSRYVGSSFGDDRATSNHGASVAGKFGVRMPLFMANFILRRFGVKTMAIQVPLQMDPSMLKVFPSSVIHLALWGALIQGALNLFSP